MAHFCPYCGEEYSRREHLERHITKHTGVKPHRCAYCCLSYTRKDLLQRHISTYHETQSNINHNRGSSTTIDHTPPPPPLGQTPIACQSCASAKTGCDKLAPCSRCQERRLTCVPRFARRSIKMKAAAAASRAVHERGLYYGGDEGQLSQYEGVLQGGFMADNPGLEGGAMVQVPAGEVWPGLMPWHDTGTIPMVHVPWMEQGISVDGVGYVQGVSLQGVEGEMMVQQQTHSSSGSIPSAPGPSIPSDMGVVGLYGTWMGPPAGEKHYGILSEGNTIKIWGLEELQCRLVAMQEKVAELEWRLGALDTLVGGMGASEAVDLDAGG